jgi:hypothetical protein
MRGWSDESVMDKSLTPHVNVNVPEAPGAGLFLDEMDFHTYNDEKNRGTMAAITWEGNVEAKCDRFKKCIIIPEVVRSEMSSSWASAWLCDISLTRSKYFVCRQVSSKLILKS